MDSTQQAELETIARLAKKARKEGVQLYRDRRDGRHYASSATTPGKRYYVTLMSCTCIGFQTHQRCKHWAALNVAFMLQDGHNPEPTECPQCHDSGVVESGRSRWVGGGLTGYRSTWIAKEPCAACAPVEVAA